MRTISTKGTNETNVPNGWDCLRICDVATVMNGSGFPEHFQGRVGLQYPYIKVSDMNAEGADTHINSAANTVNSAMLGELGAKTCPAGTVVFPKVGGALLTNKKRILGVEAAFDNNVMGVIPQKVESLWLYYWFLNFDLRILANTQALPSIRQSDVAALPILLPPIPTQRRIAAQLKAQLAEVNRARAALQAQIDTTNALVAATLRESLTSTATTKVHIAGCLREVTQGIGPKWSDYPVLGATRAGLAPAKESVGKAPERYKPVRVGTVFYNPMRILLGSIAMVDEGEVPGITSPDYVVMTAVEGVLHPRWFYHWFRSEDGAEFVRSLTRGAVRERLLFKRLAPAEIRLPPWSVQARAAETIRAATVVREKAQCRLTTLNRLPAAVLRQVFGETEEAC